VIAEDTLFEKRDQLGNVVNNLINQYVDSILTLLEITAAEWNPVKHIRVFWEGPKSSVGRTTWPKGEQPTLENTDVCLFLENTLYYGHYDNFVYRIISTLAHELMHVQQIKQNRVFDAPYQHAFEIGYSNYREQALEQEARAFAMSFVNSVIEAEKVYVGFL
jgi:hypothetical protein